jgi:hypothetical protein
MLRHGQLNRVYRVTAEVNGRHYGVTWLCPPPRCGPCRFDAAVATIRLKLLKLGARVSTSVRRIHFAIASSCPNQSNWVSRSAMRRIALTRV